VLFQLDEIPLIIEEFRAGAERRCQPGSTASRFTARTGYLPDQFLHKPAEPIRASI
jgi:2,4-dienoyl-CoA reductase-like NADH-dependent reductase (Old Yellow Enzyme family)